MFISFLQSKCWDFLVRLISTKELSSSTHLPNYNLPDITNGNNGVVNHDFVDVAEDLENIDLGNIDITRNIILQQNKALTQLRLVIHLRTILNPLPLRIFCCECPMKNPKTQFYPLSKHFWKSPMPMGQAKAPQFIKLLIIIFAH